MNRSITFERPCAASTPSLSQAICRHPLVAYFTFAFVATWIFFIPMLLSRGLGLINLPDWAALLSFILATYAGPFAAALVLTRTIEGPQGLHKLFQRMLQWRVGFKWYLILLIGYPLMFITGITALRGLTSISLVVQHWPLFFTFYLPNILGFILLPGIGEETGWRGFALPRLQAGYGPMLGTLILGGLHALWHLPAYFVPGIVLDTGFSFNYFLANSCSIILLTIIWTWLFNNTAGSILFAILVHATSNAANALVAQIYGTSASFSPWLSTAMILFFTLLVVLFTRGRLSYRENNSLF